MYLSNLFAEGALKLLPFVVSALKLLPLDLFGLRV